MICNDLDIDIQKLTIGTFNLRGFKNGFKQDALIKSFKDQNLNIIALQETHLIEREVDFLKEKWQGPIFFSEGTIEVFINIFMYIFCLNLITEFFKLLGF